MEQDIAEKIDDGMMPELGAKSVTVGDRTLQIIEMPVFYVKLMNRMMSPIYGFLSGGQQINAADLLNAEKIDQFYETMLDLAALCVIHKPPADKEYVECREFLEKNAGEKKLIEIINLQLEVNGLVNFFKDILKGVMGLVPGQPIPKP